MFKLFAALRLYLWRRRRHNRAIEQGLCACIECVREAERRRGIAFCTRAFATRPPRSLLDRALRRFVLWAPFGLLTIAKNSGELYLARAYLSPRWLPWQLPYLHCLWNDDDPEAWHNHPWKRSTSLILEGGYFDHRLEALASAKAFAVKKAGGGVQNTYERKPRDLVVVCRWTFHNIELRDGHAWTLFFAGERVEGPEDTKWGFIEVKNGEYTPWLPYINRARDKNYTIDEEA